MTPHVSGSSGRLGCVTALAIALIVGLPTALVPSGSSWFAGVLVGCGAASVPLVLQGSWSVWWGGGLRATPPPALYAEVARLERSLEAARWPALTRYAARGRALIGPMNAVFWLAVGLLAWNVESTRLAAVIGVSFVVLVALFFTVCTAKRPRALLVATDRAAFRRASDG